MSPTNGRLWYSRVVDPKLSIARSFAIGPISNDAVQRAQHGIPVRGNMRAVFLYAGRGRQSPRFDARNAGQPMVYCIIGTQKCPMSMVLHGTWAARMAALAAARVNFAADWLNRTHDSAPFARPTYKNGV
jgi:hypothetical protein